MNLPKRVRLVEVGPRDGLQNEARPVPVEAKVKLIDALSAAGHGAVEAGSFVSPKWVPQMASTDEVMSKIKRKPGVSYPVLVPNKQGMNGAVESKCGEIAIFTAASEAFCRKNTNCSIDESFERFEPVSEVRQEGNVFQMRVKVLGEPQDWWRPGMSGVCKVNAGKRSLLWILTHRTIETIRQNMKTKVGAKTIAGLVMYAMKNKLLD